MEWPFFRDADNLAHAEHLITRLRADMARLEATVPNCSPAFCCVSCGETSTTCAPNEDGAPVCRTCRDVPARVREYDTRDHADDPDNGIGYWQDVHPDDAAKIIASEPGDDTRSPRVATCTSPMKDGGTCDLLA